MSNLHGRKFSVQIGYAVKEVRKQRGMLLHQAMAKYHEYTGNAVRDWANIENGLAVINKKTIIAICEVLGTTINGLLSEIKEQESMIFFEVGEVIQSVDYESVYLAQGGYAAIMAVNDDMARLSSGDTVDFETIRRHFRYVSLIGETRDESTKLYFYQASANNLARCHGSLLTDDKGNPAWSYEPQTKLGYEEVAVYLEDVEAQTIESGCLMDYEAWTSVLNQDAQKFKELVGENE